MMKIKPRSILARWLVPRDLIIIEVAVDHLRKEEAAKAAIKEARKIITARGLDIIDISSGFDSYFFN
jgi:hypothetical protein